VLEPDLERLLDGEHVASARRRGPGDPLNGDLRQTLLAGRRSPNGNQARRLETHPLALVSDPPRRRGSRGDDRGRHEGQIRAGTVRAPRTRASRTGFEECIILANGPAGLAE